MSRSPVAANSVGKVTITPYFVEPATGRERVVPKADRANWPDSVVSRWRVRGWTRLQDRTRRDPETGAFAAGDGKEIKFWSSTGNIAVCEREVLRRAKATQAVALRRAATFAKGQDDGRRIGVLLESVLMAGEANGEFSAGTLAAYRNAQRRLAATGLLDEVVTAVGPKRVHEALFTITAAAGKAPHSSQGGTAAARTARSVLSLVFKVAIAQGWITVNPVRDTGEIRRPQRRAMQPVQGIDHSRSLTKKERVALAWSVARSERAKRLDVRDLVLAGLAIGGRIWEMCAIRWCDVSFSSRPTAKGQALTARVTISGTVARHRGKGVSRDLTKTASSVRSIPVPTRVAALFRRRARAARVQLDRIDEDLRPVFPAPGRWELPEERIQLRDSSNTAAALRAEFDRAGLDWLTFHGLRRSAVTALADVLPIRAVADFAGHSSIKTTIDSYLARSAVSDQVADLL